MTLRDDLEAVAGRGLAAPNGGAVKSRSIHPKLRQTQPRVGCHERGEVAGLGDVQIQCPSHSGIAAVYIPTQIPHPPLSQLGSIRVPLQLVSDNRWVVL